MRNKFNGAPRTKVHGTAARMSPLVALICLSFSAGCCDGAGRRYTDEDARGFLPAYAEWRFVCGQSSKFDPRDLPPQPSVGCAYDNLCDEKDLILTRLRQKPGLYSRLGTVRESEVERGVPGEDLATGTVAKSFSAHEFEYLCEDAVAGGYDIVVISYHNDFTVIQGGRSRVVSASCSGAIIAARSRQVIAPILVQYGTSSSSITGNASAPDANAPTLDDMQAQFADQVATKLETILTARAAATRPSAASTAVPPSTRP